MKRIILAALVGVLVSGTARNAEAITKTFTGQFVIENCRFDIDPQTLTASKAMNSSMCFGYIEGLQSGAIIMEGIRKSLKISGLNTTQLTVSMACPPHEASINQLIAVAVKYLRKIPEKWHLTAGAHIFLAWREVWPCK